VKSGNAQLLAADSDILSRQHGSVGGGLITVGLDLHATRYTGNGFAATGITHVSLLDHFISHTRNSRSVVEFAWQYAMVLVVPYLPEIGDVNEGVVEAGEDACDAEDELALAHLRTERDVLLGPVGCLCVMR
jgi:hypothetical protein